MQTVIADPDPHDPWNLGATKFGNAAPELLGNVLDGLRVGFVARAGNKVVSEDALAAARNTASLLEWLGVTIDEVTTPVDWNEQQDRILYMGSIFAGFPQFLPEWTDRLDPSLVGFIEQGRSVTLTQFPVAQAARSTLFRAVQELFSRYDVLLSPTLTCGALPVEVRPGRDVVEVDCVACGTMRQGWS